MLKLLEQTSAALESGDWFAAAQFLQQLLLKRNSVSIPVLEEPALQIALNFALKILQAGDFQERWEIAKVFPELGERSISPLVALLQAEERDFEERWFAARILGEFNDPKAAIALVDLLQTSEDEDLAAIAAAALAKVGDRAIETLAALLARPELRERVAKVLAQMSCPQTIEPLLSVVKDENIAVRATAVEALGRMRDRRIPPTLIQALDDRAGAVRKEAAIALGLRSDLWQDWPVRERLQPLLYDLKGEVCQQAAVALGRMGTPAATAALFNVLKSPTTPPPLQLDLLRAIAWIETSQNLSYLQQAIPFVSDEGVEEIIKLLGRVKSPQLQPLAARISLNFFRAQTRPRTAIKQALAQSWGQLQAQETRLTLVEWLGDPVETVRLHAIAALKHFPEAPEAQQPI